VGLSGPFISPQFLAIEPHFVRKGSPALLQIAIFGDRTSFRAKRLRREPGNRNFTSVFGDRTSFRAKALKIEKASNSGFQPKIKAASLKSPCCTSPKTKLLALNQGWKLCFEAGKCRLAALILS
jgi:hypothetical protein